MAVPPIRFFIKFADTKTGIMKILYFIGVALGLWCVYDLFKNKTIDLIWKIIIAVILLSCSWVGVLVYYFFVRNRLK